MVDLSLVKDSMFAVTSEHTRSLVGLGGSFSYLVMPPPVGFPLWNASECGAPVVTFGTHPCGTVLYVFMDPGLPGPVTLNSSAWLGFESTLFFLVWLRLQISRWVHINRCVLLF